METSEGLVVEQGNLIYKEGDEGNVMYMIKSGTVELLSEKLGYEKKKLGSGDFFGTEQHGLPEFKIANLFEDIGTLKRVQALAIKIMEDDPLLEKEKNKKLNELVKEKFSSRIEI